MSNSVQLQSTVHSQTYHVHYEGAEYRVVIYMDGRKSKWIDSEIYDMSGFYADIDDDLADEILDFIESSIDPETGLELNFDDDN